MKEQTFNKWFSIFILASMTVATAIITAINIKNSSGHELRLIIAAIGSLMGIMCAIFSANAKIITFIFGFFDVSIYAVMCFLGERYGNAALHAFYFVPMQFIGYFQWLKRGARENKQLQVRVLSGKKRFLFALLFLAGTVVVYLVLAKFDKSAADSFLKIALLTDAIGVVCNVLGQMLMSTAYLEQWIFWLGVNVASVIMWTVSLKQNPENDFALIYILKYGFYFLNSLNGLRIWIGLYKKQ